MEAALLSMFLSIILAKLLSLVEDKYKLLRGMKSDMEFLEKELKMILSIIDEKASSGSGNLKRVHKISIEELLKLAHQIEDCIDGLMYHAIREQHVSLAGRFFCSLRRQHTLQKFAEKLKRLRTLPAEEHERSKRYESLGSSSGTSSCGLPPADEDAPEQQILGRTGVDPPIGIGAPLNELVEQLVEEAEVHLKKLKVISIVGIPGSGKTVLAWALYNSEAAKEFVLRAWVPAGQSRPGELLMNILHQLGGSRTTLDSCDDITQIILDLRQHLEMEKKRYLIVIDDMRTDQWETIENAFPRDSKLSSRIVVTTTVQTVAKASSFANVNVHIHKMERLDKDNSEELFVRKACLEIHSKYWHPDSVRILEKCDGQPLALVSVGQFLRKKGWPTERGCDHVCRRLRHHLLEDEAFERIRRMLFRIYSSLPGNAPKSCLMYFGMFPTHHPIRRKSMMRLWLAEGYGALDQAEENFDAFIDQNIIESIEESNNSNVKTCKTYGMMREFILSKSISQGFIALIGNETLQTRPSHVRGLSLYHSTATDDSRLHSDLKHVRYLRISGDASEAILDFREYQLLRILDLEGCTAGLGDDRLENICNLSLLKYLSLGSTVHCLPKQIKKLKLLETLDLKRSNVKILPIEVILLPSLVHLFGEFQLQVKKMREVLKLLKLGKSNVETLAGFITDGSDAIAEIMIHMKKLSKVKIWCQGTTSNSGFAKLEDAIQKFIHDDNQESNEPRSLSLHFDKCYDKCPEDLLDSLKAPCYLRSLKIHGEIVKLPQFILSLRNLTELCIEALILRAGLLEKLGDLKFLKYLKLMAHHLEDFIIKSQSFRRLLRLSLVLEVPTLPTFKEGDMEYLSSLHLICKNLVGLSGMRIEYLYCLKDVTLHPGVTRATKEEWEQAAKRHPGRPKILFLQKADTNARELSYDYDSSGSDESVSTESSSTPDGPAELCTDTRMLLHDKAGSSFA